MSTEHGTTHSDRSASQRGDGRGTASNVDAHDLRGTAEGDLEPVRSSATDCRNRILAAMSRDDYEWIARLLTPVDLPATMVLYTPNGPVADVYFLEAGVCSVINRMADGSRVEVGTIGPEGIVGLSAVFDAGSSPSETVVQVGGAGFRAPAAAIAEAFSERASVRRVIMRYAQAYLTQVAQTAACNASHPVEERCARWLLMTHDRVNQAPSFRLTHQFLAVMLAVRRAGVSVAAGTLQRAGLIRYSRGQVTVLDRDGLEQACCECYGIVRREFDRLVGGG